MSLFASASAALFAATSAVNGGSVTVTRSSVGSFVTTAAFGRSVLLADDGGGGRIEVESFDFLIPASSYTFGNSSFPAPLEGDQVARVVGSVTQTYELMTPPYTPSDRAGVIFRLHSKLVNSQ